MDNKQRTYERSACSNGDNRVIREWAERNHKNYVLCVSRKEYINDWTQYTSVGNILDCLPEKGWFSASCGKGTKGLRVYDWFCMDIEAPREEGFKRCLLVRRNPSDHSDMQAHICSAPAETTLLKLIRVAGTRWTVEMCFEESKSEVGMDEYEFRSYDG